MTLACDWKQSYPDSEHVCDEGECCECGGNHCCSHSLCPVNVSQAPGNLPDSLTDANGDFMLSDGTLGNPGCDECGELDAVIRIGGTYLCATGWAEREEDEE